jgi:hypothetical protein
VFQEENFLGKGYGIHFLMILLHGWKENGTFDNSGGPVGHPLHLKMEVKYDGSSLTCKNMVVGGGGGGTVFLFLLCCKKPALGLCVILVLYCIVSTVGVSVSFLFVNFVIDVAKTDDLSSTRFSQIWL